MDRLNPKDMNQLKSQDVIDGPNCMLVSGKLSTNHIFKKQHKSYLKYIAHSLKGNLAYGNCPQTIA